MVPHEITVREELHKTSNELHNISSSSGENFSLRRDMLIAMQTQPSVKITSVILPAPFQGAYKSS